MRISFKKKASSKMGPFKPTPTKPVLKKVITKKPIAKPVAKPKPNTTSVTGERIEKKITPGGMYKIKNVYDNAGNLVSSDTGRTVKGIFRGAIKKGKVSRT